MNNGKLKGTIRPQGVLKGRISRVIETVDPVIQPLEVTENGEYTAPENVHGFNPVKVDVPLRYEEGYEDGYQASQDSIKLQEKTTTENGEVVTDEGFTGMSKVIVAVPIKEEQEKTVEITKNGTTEVVADEGKSMSKVTVNTNVAFEGDIGKPYIDTSKLNSFKYFFASGNRYSEEIARRLDTSNGTNFSKMFYQAMYLTEIIEGFDTSKGTDFSEMFYNCPRLKAIPQLDTSKGTAFSGMFYKCSAITTIPQIDTSNGTNFGDMFLSCKALKEIPFLLDLRKSNGASGMFSGCTSLETVSITTAKSNLSTYTFQNCTALKNITIGEGWAVNIYLHYSNELTVESLHGMIENLADLTGQTAKIFQVGATNIAKIDEAHIQMLNDKNWTYS